jgi:phosphotransferase system enzyme I (PtsI)
VELGIMVEIPAAAVLLDAFLPHVDFVSVGTNDLIQYTLAVDRINENVTHLYDPFHPAVLRLIQNVATMAHRAGKWVSVCGEMTSDPHAVPLLVGMGCDSLSISPRMYLRVKETVRGLRYAAMAKLVAKAVTCSDSEEIRRLMREQGL